MTNRILSRAALLFLLAALTAPTANVAALNGGQAPARGQAKSQAKRMTEGAQKGATYDEAGRAVKTTVPTSESERVTVNLKYDERNRVQSVVLDDGTQVGLVYDAAGLWQGFSFADGGKMLFERDASGKINGLRRVARAARQQSRDARSGALQRVGLGAPRVLDNCAAATVAAVTAATNAVAICALGTVESCAAAVISAAAAALRAYNACRNTSAAAEESVA